jgi:branched-chain amino acid transport system ATP-binding protein
MLRLDDVHVHIGKLHILQGVNLEVRAGECAALLGRNGVGKTTTLRAIMGLAPRTRGTVEFDGLDLARCEAHEIPRKGIGYVPQGRGIFPNLTVLENLCIGLPGKRDSEREQYIFGCFPRLKERLKQSGNTLSGGEQQMLAIARCLMMRPKLIILDEPTEGIMPRLVSQIRREIHRINQTGVSILLVEQNVETALKLCPRVFLMEKGAVVYNGASHELKSQPEIVHRYLGLSQ